MSSLGPLSDLFDIDKEKEPQKRMKLMVKYFKAYIKTYDKQYGYENYSDTTFINDVLYGLGVAIDPNNHQYSNGFDVWKKKLMEFLKDELSDSYMD